MKLFYRFMLFLSMLAMLTPSHASKICNLLSKHPSWKKAAKKSEIKWGVPVAVQFAIINVESEFKANAKNRKSSARGFAQALNEPWADYLKAIGKKHKRNQFHAATDFIGWYGSQVKKVIGVSPKNAYQFYIAYHEGFGGYKSFKKHPKRSVKKLASRVSSHAKRYKKQLENC
jgi:hypothetical protein